MALVFTGKKAEQFTKLEKVIVSTIKEADNESYTVADDLVPFIIELQDVTGLLHSCSPMYIMGEVNMHCDLITKLAQQVDGRKYNKAELSKVRNMVKSYFIHMMFSAKRAHDMVNKQTA